MKRESDINQTASNLASVSGVLAGFVGTLIVLFLSQDLQLTQSSQDITLNLFLIAGAMYITASGLLANVPSQLRSHMFGYNLGVTLFLLANVFFSYSFAVILSDLSFPSAGKVAYVTTGVAGIIFLNNLLRIIIPLVRLYRKNAERARAQRRMKDATTT